MSEQLGVILAGGLGTRMDLPYNKQAHTVYDQPMLSYPLMSLREMGVDRTIVVSSPTGVSDIQSVLEDGFKIDYRVQPRPDGMADALRYAGPIKGVFPVLCGDVYFDPSPPTSDVPALIAHEFEGAYNHTVWDSETNTLQEKPAKALGQKAIVAYWFDEQVFDLIDDIMPSCRGELELVDIYSYYLAQGAPVLEYEGFFGDMGTPDGMLRVANHEQERQHAHRNV